MSARTEQGLLAHAELEQVAVELRKQNCQRQTGMDLVPVADFSFYDQILDASFLLGNVPERALGHYTHEKNPVACAAGLATIECLEADGLLENARLLGERALRRIEKMKKTHALIGGARGLGLLLGIELAKNRKTREPASDAAERVMYRALEKGLSFKVSMGNILTLTPPLTITKRELDRALDIIEECVAEVGRVVLNAPPKRRKQRRV